MTSFVHADWSASALGRMWGRASMDPTSTRCLAGLFLFLGTGEFCFEQVVFMRFWIGYLG